MRASKFEEIRVSHNSFGQFLLSKKQAPGILGELAQSAARDPRFPRYGDPQEISKILHRHEAPPEFHEAMEEAVTEWQSLN